MRIRTIKPDFFKSDRLADLQPIERLLFIGLWCCADANGVLENRPRRIKAEVFPYDDIDMNAALSALCQIGILICYGEAPGKHPGSTWEATGKYLLIPGFREHQRISGKEVSSGGRYPLPDQLLQKEKHPGSTREAPGKHPGAQEGKGREGNKEGKGREGKGGAGGAAPPTITDRLREAGAAVRSDTGPQWRELVNRHSLARVLAAIDESGRSPCWPSDVRRVIGDGGGEAAKPEPLKPLISPDEHERALELARQVIDYAAAEMDLTKPQQAAVNQIRRFYDADDPIGLSSALEDWNRAVAMEGAA